MQDKTMSAFEFKKPVSKSTVEPPFIGAVFYNIYKESEFLRDNENIMNILSMGYQIRQKLKEMKPGDVMPMVGLQLEKNTPLLLKNTGLKVTVENYEFTYNRLCGLTAAYAFENRHRLPKIQSPEAEALGLKWDNLSEKNARLYLSAVSGTEHFIEQFSYWPLVCGLKKLQQNKITLQPIVKMAKIKNNNGEIMAKVLTRNKNLETTKIWQQFPGSKPEDLVNLIETSPPQLKNMFLTK